MQPILNTSSVTYTLENTVVRVSPLDLPPSLQSFSDDAVSPEDTWGSVGGEGATSLLQRQGQQQRAAGSRESPQKQHGAV